MTHLTDLKPRYRTGDNIRNVVKEGERKTYVKGHNIPYKKNTTNTQNYKSVVFSVKFRDDENPFGHAVAWFYGKRFPLWKRFLIRLIGGEIVEGKYFSSVAKKHDMKSHKQCGFRWEGNEL